MCSNVKLIFEANSKELPGNESVCYFCGLCETVLIRKPFASAPKCLMFMFSCKVMSFCHVIDRFFFPQLKEFVRKKIQNNWHNMPVKLKSVVDCAGDVSHVDTKSTSAMFTS